MTLNNKGSDCRKSVVVKDLGKLCYLSKELEFGLL